MSSPTISPAPMKIKRSMSHQNIQLALSDSLSRHHVSTVSFALHKYKLLLEMLPMTLIVVVIRIILDLTVKE